MRNEIGSSQAKMLPGLSVDNAKLNRLARGERNPSRRLAASCTASSQTVARSGGLGLSLSGRRSGPAIT